MKLTPRYLYSAAGSGNQTRNLKVYLSHFITLLFATFKEPLYQLSYPGTYLSYDITSIGIIVYICKFIFIFIFTFICNSDLLSLNLSHINQQRKMKTEPIPHQAKPKSIMDLTPFEISQIDAFQNRNRGFFDEADEDLENDFMNWED